ncbi:MAG: GAF domain-containing protein [Chloroflexia bacterium]
MAEDTGGLSSVTRLAELEERLRSLELEYQRQRQDLRSAYQEIFALTTLQEITLTLLATLEPAVLMKQIANSVVSLLGAEGSALFLRLPDTDELVLQVVAGSLGDRGVGRRVRVGQGLTGWVAQSGTPLLVEDPAADPRFSPEVDGYDGTEIRSLLCVPLQFQGQPLGVIAAVNKGGVSPFDIQDLKRLKFLAALAAVLLERIRLYERLSEDRDRVLVAQEELRRRLARELHDGPAQLLVHIVMQVEYIRKLMQAGEPSVSEELGRLAEIAQQAVYEMRALLFDLRPIILETQGLPAAIHLFVERHQKEGGPQLHVHFDESVDRYDPQVESSVFGIVQEAVNNALRHADARNIWVRGEEKGGMLVIDIEDDGKGFNLESVLQRYDERGSFGLVNMRERAELVGGHLTLVSALGQGTTVTLRVPVAKR